MHTSQTQNLCFWPKRPPLAFSVAETSVAEMSRPKCPWPKCPSTGEIIMSIHKIMILLNEKKDNYIFTLDDDILYMR